jgi:hypothetical protein
VRAPWKLTNPTAAFDASLCNVHTLLSRPKPIEGEVGLEVEVEGNQFPKTNEAYDEEDLDMGEEYIPSQWRYTHDGSLRGYDNAEYILAKPLNFNEVPGALQDLWRMFDEFGSVLDESNRTSVHVHLNAQSWHLNRVASFLGLYFSVEEILVNWCGDHRAGNLFCLRAKDAPAIVNRARKFIKTGDLAVFDDGQHYAGVNLEALRNKGSIEIRSMRGATHYEPIQTWVSILERIYHLSGEFEDPRLVVAQFSGGGALNYVKFVLGEHTEEVLANVQMTPQDVVRSVTEGIRLAQNVCYCRDWSVFKPSKVSADPFGRNPVKVAQSLDSDPVEEYLSSPVAPEPQSLVSLSAFSVFQEFYNAPAPPTAPGTQWFTFDEESTVASTPI